jgi:serine/threonine-protein kinase
LRPELPEPLERVVLRCLEKSPERRYPTIAHLARALEPFATPGERPSVERIERMLAGSARRRVDDSGADTVMEERAETFRTWEGDKPAPDAPKRWRRRTLMLSAAAALAVAAATWRLRTPNQAVAPAPSARNSAASAGLPSVWEMSPLHSGSASVAPVSPPVAPPVAVASANAAPSATSVSKPARAPEHRTAAIAVPSGRASTSPRQKDEDGTSDRK